MITIYASVDSIILYSQKFLSGEKFHSLRPLLSRAKFFILQFFVHVNDYIDACDDLYHMGEILFRKIVL